MPPTDLAHDIGYLLGQYLSLLAATFNVAEFDLQPIDWTAIFDKVRAAISAGISAMGDLTVDGVVAIIDLIIRHGVLVCALFAVAMLALFVLAAIVVVRVIRQERSR